MKSKKFTIIDELPNLDSEIFEEEITLLKDILCSLILELTPFRKDDNLVSHQIIKTTPKEVCHRESGLICSGKHQRTG